MIFVPLLLLGIYFYFTGKRVFSVLIFFYFLTDGFQLVPQTWFETDVIISKGTDFAIIYTLSIVVLGGLAYRGFFKRDKFTRPLWIFVIFVMIVMLVSWLEYNVEWEDIIKTPRNYFLMFGYFIFRKISGKELNKIVRILFYITSFMCVLYILQAFSGIPLLSGLVSSQKVGILKIRGYNIPMLYYFFLFFVLFTNPFKGRLKYISSGIFVLVIILSMHRGMILAAFLMAFLGIYYSQNGLKGVFKYVFIGGFLLMPVFDIVADRFERGGSSSDIELVMAGEFLEYDQSMDDGTFLFRVALFYERFEYVTKDITTSVFGVGLMHEKSDLTKKKFDFMIGAANEDNDYEPVQLDTSDMAWINLMLRIGFLGLILYVYIYVFLCKYFYKRRTDKRMLVALLYLLFMLLIAFTASITNESFMLFMPFIYCIIKEQEEVEEQNTNIHELQS